MSIRVNKGDWEDLKYAVEAEKYLLAIHFMLEIEQKNRNKGLSDVLKKMIPKGRSDA